MKAYIKFISDYNGQNNENSEFWLLNSFYFMTFIENLQKCSGTVKQDLNWQTSHKWNNKTLHNYNKKFFFCQGTMWLKTVNSLNRYRQCVPTSNPLGNV